MKISQKARNAIFLGTLCSISYFAVYIARNVLGAVKTDMYSGGFTESYVGIIEFAYLTAYAIGQLINGAIGDRIKAKYMICAGLLFAGISNIVFTNVAATQTLAIIAYACTGFFLSMIYGPMTKVVSESTDLLYATRCSLGYTFSSFFATPMAGVLAMMMSWQETFTVSSIALIGMAVICFVFFIIFEKKGIVKYPKNQLPQNSAERHGSIKTLIQHKIIKFSVISMITGVIRTSLVALLTTYFCKHLLFSDTEAKGIFSTVTVFIAMSAFIAIFTYERLLGKDLQKCVFLFFSLAAVFFIATYFITSTIVNIVFIVLAIIASNSAASALWSIYCPSLCDTGLVSSATGFLDFLSYMASALASLVFGFIIESIGCGLVILICIELMVIGVVICLPDVLKKKAQNNN